MKTAIIIEAPREGYSIDQVSNTLTVQELIGVLSQFDGDSRVYLSHDNGYTFGGIREGNIEERYPEEER